MNINIYLEDILGKQLALSAKRIGKSRNTIIREAIREWLESHQAVRWPKIIMEYKGHPEIPAFETARDELLPPKKDPFQ